MKRFRFSLERVLAIRELEEERARASWRSAEKAREEAEEDLRRLREERLDGQHHLANLRREHPLPLASLEDLERQLDWMAQRERTLLERGRAATREAAIRLVELRAARQRREGLDRLRGRRAAEHVKRVTRRAELLVDDLVARDRSPEGTSRELLG